MKRDFVYSTIIAILLAACMVFFRKYQDSRIAARMTSKPSEQEIVSNDLSRIGEYTKLPGFPIQYDTNLAEYQLVYSYPEGIDRMPIAYCPWTGTKLPRSKRDESFNVLTSNETQKIMSRLQGIGSLNDAKRVLGVPDDVITGPLGNVQTQWTYSHVSEKVNIVVQVLTDGSLAINLQPKPK